MNYEQGSVAFAKSKTFSLRIVKLYKFLCDEKKEYVLSKQLLRAGTSISANLAEARCAISKKDFLNKAYISFKECAETLYWLDLLHDADYLTPAQYESIYADCNELYKMLSATTATLRSNMNL